MPKECQGDLFSEITLFLKRYNLNISRFQQSDMLVFIADIARYALKTGIEDITRFFGF